MVHRGICRPDIITMKIGSMKRLKVQKYLSIKMVLLSTIFVHVFTVVGRICIFIINKCGHRNVLSKRQVWMSIFHINMRQAQHV